MPLGNLVMLGGDGMPDQGFIRPVPQKPRLSKL
jgi:hypothetical protein